MLVCQHSCYCLVCCANSQWKVVHVGNQFIKFAKAQCQNELFLGCSMYNCMIFMLS